MVLIILGMGWMLAVGIWLGLTIKKCGPECASTAASFSTEQELVVITETKPHQILYITTVTGSGEDYEDVRFFDGSDWNVQSDEPQLRTAHSNPLSRVEQTVSGGWNVANQNIVLPATTILLTMPIKTDTPMYKFGGAVGGEIVINGKPQKAKTAYFKVHNFDRSYLNLQTAGVNTDWLVFWDEKGNFFHIDNTSVRVPTKTYTSHLFAGSKSLSGETKIHEKVRVRYDKNLKVILGDTDTLLDVQYGSRFPLGDFFGDKSTAGVAETREGGIGVFSEVRN